MKFYNHNRVRSSWYSVTTRVYGSDFLSLLIHEGRGRFYLDKRTLNILGTVPVVYFEYEEDAVWYKSVTAVVSPSQTLSDFFSNWTAVVVEDEESKSDMLVWLETNLPPNGWALWKDQIWFMDQADAVSFLIKFNGSVAENPFDVK